MNFMKHLPWAAPTVAILAVGSGFLDRINISFDGAEAPVAQSEPVDVTPDPAAAALAAVMAVTTAPEPTEPANVADQLAALLEEPQDVDVTRNSGFSVSAVQETLEPVMEAAAPVAAPQAAAPSQLGADFFNSAQANLERDRRCIDDLRTLASQARVYFPSGGLNADQSGIEQARLLGVLAQQCPGVSIEVSGHSDPSGDPAVNRRLSLERAEAVVTRVTASGVDASLFVAVGRGDSVPSNITGPQPASFYDRRVEFAIVENAVPASFAAPSFGVPGTQFQKTACVLQLEAATSSAFIEYAARGMTMSDADFAMATQLGTLAARCPQARLRVVGLHSDAASAGEDPSTARLRAVVLMTRLVSQGIPSGQIILGAPSEPRPMAGRSDSRVDFDVIYEEL